MPDMTTGIAASRDNGANGEHHIAPDVHGQKF